jgi:hypothetical protein
LAEDQRAMREELRALAEDQRALKAEVRALAEDLRKLTQLVARLIDKVAWLDGAMLEITYSRKVGGYFGSWLRRPQVVDTEELWDQLDAHLNRDERKDALLTDVVIRGRVTNLADRPEAYLVVEVSAVIDENDVTRAIRRAELFRRAGYPAIPTVAGRIATSTADALAESRGVALLEDGTDRHWERALACWPVA